MEEMRLEGYRNLILGITNIRGATEIQDLDRSKRQFLRSGRTRFGQRVRT
ncbi:hypothetical protein LINPERPRIM_LOCUS20457 [Linum perenne]